MKLEVTYSADDVRELIERDLKAKFQGLGFTQIESISVHGHGATNASTFAGARAVMKEEHEEDH